MNSRITLLLALIFLFTEVQICSAQNSDEKVSLVNMPAFVKELQQALPSREIMQSDPKLYQSLLRRRQELSVLLINAVRQHKLPESALQFLQPRSPVENNNPVSTRSFTNTTTEGNFRLVKDINQDKNSNPANSKNNGYDYQINYAVLNSIIYYSADDGIHVNELWRSDGTDTGTYIVKNIAAGSNSSNPKNITSFNNKIYFTANNQNRGYELYQSDGTAAGTILLKGANAGVINISQLTVAKDKLYFATYYKLWKTDGTSKGTILVKDFFNSSPSEGNLQYLTSLNGNIFFTIISQGELWYSDGTTSGTIKLKNRSSMQSGAMNLTIHNGKLYFNDYYGDKRTLWESDGTVNGTKSLFYNNVEVTFSQYKGYFINQPLPIVNNEIYFAGDTSYGIINLYKYNLTAKNTMLVKTISSTTNNIFFSVENLRSMDNNVYFFIPNSNYTGYNLWKSGGDSTTTNIIKAFTGSVGIANFYTIGKKLYFDANSKENGYEPWISDGTTIGTKILKDISSGAQSSNPSGFTACNGKIYFSAYSPDGGIELWKTDGTTVDTKQVKDINTTTTASAVSDKLITLSQGKIIFAAFTPSTGTELWKTDGTESGTELVKDLTPGDASSIITFYYAINDKAYFTVYNDTSGSDGIYVTDGTTIGTKKIANVTGYLEQLKVTNNGIVFYTTYVYGILSYSYKLWRTDNKGNNFMLDSNIDNRYNYSYSIGVAGKLCYFSDAASGRLFKSDGTISGTKALGAISDIANFIPFNNKIIFRGYSFEKGYGQWISDGTTKGTFYLKNIFIFPDAGSAVLNDKLFFTGTDSIGIEIFKTDGTPENTKVVKSISGFSNPANFITVKNSVYFTVPDINNRSQLWKTFGSNATTKLIKTLSFLQPENLIVSNEKLYFIDSSQLWVSDGTDTGTQVIIDPSNITSVYSIATTDNKLFFDGYSYNYGDELYVTNSINNSKQQNNAVAKTLIKPVLNAKLVTNPFINNIIININSPQKQTLQITINTITGQTLTGKKIHINAGENLITLDAAKYLHGVYAITISSSSAIINLKAVK